MFKVVKSLEALEIVGQKNVSSLSELVDHKQLRSVFATSSAGATRRRIIDTMAILSRQGFVSVGQLDGERIYKLSAKGKKHLATYSILKAGVVRPARWDGNWHLVTFDIPERQKVARNSLISHLKNQGFINYTKGIWILPYNPKRFLTDLAQHLGLTSQIKLIEARKIDDEAKYKRHFRLK